MKRAAPLGLGWPRATAWRLRAGSGLAGLGLSMVLAGVSAQAWAAGTPAPEVQVTSSAIIDYEFDWARDGVYCGSCNNGAGNSRLAYTDLNKRLWVAQVDFQTGAFVPTNGHGELLDSLTALATDFGNGPEWMVSNVGSQVVYTKYQPGQTPAPATAGVAVAKQLADGTWSASYLPGAMGRISPIGTMDLTGELPSLHFQDTKKTKTYYRTSDDASLETKVPVSGFNGGGRRWVPGTRKIILTGNGADGTAGAGFRQVFLYDTVTEALEQLTDEPANNVGAMMWQAPEFNNEYVFFDVRDGNELRVFRKLPDASGVPRWTVVSSLHTPDDYPYIWSPEYFVHNGKSYIFFQMNSSSNSSDLSKPNLLGMMGVLPENSGMTLLTPASAPARVRMDPEYFITAKGPYIYYNRYKLATSSKPSAPEGVYRVDTLLGPPLP